MERLIRNKRYNTETATKICELPDGEMYVKRTGELFRVNGTKIIPLTLKMGEKLALEYADEKTYKKYFSDDGSENKVLFRAYITNTQKKKFQQEAVKRKVPMSSLLGLIIDEMED